MRREDLFLSDEAFESRFKGLVGTAFALKRACQNLRYLKKSRDVSLSAVVGIV
jgi:hypothetical protein